MSDTSDAPTQEPVEALPISAMPWQREPPLHSTGGFKASVGTVCAVVGYAVWPTTVYICASIRFGDGLFQPWRSLWTPRSEAVRAAENLCGEIEDYLCGTLNGRLRETEDLDLDDFLEHLRARIENELH